MSDYQQLTRRIEELQREADRLRKQELKTVIREIRDKIRKYGITREELESAFAPTAAAGRKGAKKAGGKKGSGRRSSRAKVAPKYRHPETGATWTGRGRAPGWLVAEEAAGRKRDEFLIEKS